MSGVFTTRLVNGRQGDPALLLDLIQRKASILFDAGELAALETRSLLRVTHLFLSHAHIDHLIGFDRLLRAQVGRAATIAVYGPPGTIARIGHKLRGYTWDLVDRIDAVLRFDVHELHGARLQAARFSLQQGFAPEPLPERAAPDGLLCETPELRIRGALFAHHGPVLGFRVEAHATAVVDAAAIAARGWRPGPWVAALKHAALADASTAETPAGLLPLAALGDVVRVQRGTSLAYVTDVAGTAANRAAIVAFVAGVETLFIEAPFLAAEAERAAARGHLTARAAGEIARQAGVARVEPFHLSPRHAPEAVLAEVQAHFAPSAEGAGTPLATPGASPPTSGDRRLPTRG